MQDGVMMGGGGVDWGGGVERGSDGEGSRKEQGGGGVRGQDVNKETVTIRAGGERVQSGQ